MFRILIVEDHPLYRSVLYDALCESFPFIDIVQAADTGSALRAVDERLPDLVLTDINLGGESGLELIKTIKSLHNDLPIIVLTGHDLPEYRATASRYGAQDFLSKHRCTPEVLCGAVRRHLDLPEDAAGRSARQGHALP